MKIKIRTIQKIFWTSAVAVSILFAACSSTKFTSVWKDETYQGNPTRIMVIVVSNKPAARRLMEDEFVKELKDHETDAFASYTVLPFQSLEDKGAIDAKAREAGVDSVLITKQVSMMTGMTGDWVDEYIGAETNIYDVRSRKQVWTASTQTWINENKSDRAQIQSFVKTIIKGLLEQKLIKPEPIKREPAARNIKSYRETKSAIIIFV